MVVGMATSKLTITLPDEQLQEIRALVAAGQAANVSAFVQHAVGIAYRVGGVVAVEHLFHRVRQRQLRRQREHLAPLAGSHVARMAREQRHRHRLEDPR